MSRICTSVLTFLWARSPRPEPSLESGAGRAPDDPNAQNPHKGHASMCLCSWYLLKRVLGD